MLYQAIFRLLRLIKEHNNKTCVYDFLFDHIAVASAIASAIFQLVHVTLEVILLRNNVAVIEFVETAEIAEIIAVFNKTQKYGESFELWRNYSKKVKCDCTMV